MTGLKFPPLKPTVNKRLPEVLFYKTTGCKKAKCAKCAEGLYYAIETKTGKNLGSFGLSMEDISWSHGLGTIDYSKLCETVQSSYLYTGARKEHKRVKLPYNKEYETLYNVEAYQGEDLNKEQQWRFAHYGLQFLKNISDKFKHPIILKNCTTPEPIKLRAIGTGEFISIPRSYSIHDSFKQGRSISGKEMSDRCAFLTSNEGEGIGSIYNEQTYKNVDKYLKNNDSNALVYAEYAVHPESKKPDLKTAIKELFILLTKY